MAPKIDALKQNKQKRDLVREKLNRFQAFVDNFQEGDVTQLQLRMKKAETYWAEFDNFQTEIELLLPKDEQQSIEREQFETSYFDIMTKAQKLMLCTNNNKPMESDKGTTSQSTTEAKVESVKLPTLHLPSFSGNYEDWMPFYEVFHSLIHDDHKLTEVQKFHYLRSALKGNAAQTIESLQLTAANYSVAWDLLTKRYSNHRLIIQSHVKALFELHKLEKESAVGLRALLDNFLKHVRALEAMKQPTKSWDTLLLHIVTSKLDNTTLRAWELEVTSDTMPKMEQLTEFLQQRCHMLEAVTPAIGTTSKSNNRVAQKSVYNSKMPTTIANVATSSTKCVLCQSDHRLFHCPSFLAKSIEKRSDDVKRLGLCFNCLRGGHQTINCKSTYSCKICKRRHNSLLHSSESSSSQVNTAISSTSLNASAQSFSPSVSSQNNTLSCVNQREQSTNIMLSTALVIVFDSENQPHQCRALLDSGSQSNFMTENMASRLKLRRGRANTSVGGIGTMSTISEQYVQAIIKSRINTYIVKLEFILLPRITQNLPVTVADTSAWSFPEYVQFADPGFNTSSEIDLLLGAETFFSLLRPGQLTPPSGYPTLQQTSLGWVVSGKVDVQQSPKKPVQLCHLITSNIDHQMQRFWELDECPTSQVLTPEEKACEDHFQRTVQRNSEGRYVVRLPFKETIQQIGDSVDIATRRFRHLERKLDRNPSTKSTYTAFMKEYEDLGHMTKLTEDKLSGPSCYLPHHGVTKESSTTTKLRVVFNASAKTSTGMSLNDALMVGPVVQDDIFSIITRFRQHQYVITADIEKMYRQIRVHPEDATYQRIVWRESPSKDLSHYQLETVTYGTASAPFLATRCLQQLATDYEQRFPEASLITKRDFYVDDLLTGAATLEDAQRLQRDIHELLHLGGFELRKWKTNDIRVLNHNSQAHESDSPQELLSNQDEPVRSLGLLWTPGQDTFHFTVQAPPEGRLNTKRTMLSTISRIYDPLGLLGPVIVRAKILLQRLWALKLDWDDPLPPEVNEEWKQFLEELPGLTQVSIPRRAFQEGNIEIHGFCDASEAAYGACVYVMSIKENHLLCSKSRVAPLKKTTIPRLELCAALLLAKLTQKVLQALRLSDVKIVLWTDSTIVLAWLQAPAARWKTFVANRVAEIQELTRDFEWRHIRTEHNPADYISRGVSPGMIQNLREWWHGPRQDIDEADFDEFDNNEEPQELPECKATTTSFLAVESFNLIERYSSLNKLLRVTAYCFRFIQNARKPTQNRLFGPLDVTELQASVKALIKHVQVRAFSSELAALKARGQVEKSSVLHNLNPFIDDEGIIRVGGRISASSVSYDRKHQIVLPAKNALTSLIAVNEHIKQLHAPPQMLLSALRQTYWPINGRKLCRKVVHDCVTCFKTKPKASQQMMGELPKDRLEPTRPFFRAGMDFAGPLYIRPSKHRGTRALKSYIAVFICLATKAIHLELVGDLTTETFIGALRRFMARRGKCAHLFCDNGTTFVGASRELAELNRLFQTQRHQEKVQQCLHEENIQWHFIPPYAPNFGGLWEAAVKSAKYHLKRILGKAHLTYEEANTCLTQIEACLNSRPLTPLNSDPNDLMPLTPGHFLVGEPLTAPVEPDLKHLPFNRLSRWQYVQQLQQHFWNRWSREYLSQLQQRAKWTKKSANIQPGTLVLMKEDNLPPLQWKMGRVAQVHPGKDGLVRVATIKTATGDVQRSISKLCPFPREEI